MQNAIETTFLSAIDRVREIEAVDPSNPMLCAFVDCAVDAAVALNPHLAQAPRAHYFQRRRLIDVMDRLVAGKVAA